MDISETEMYKLGIDAMKIINENDMQLFGESNDHDSNPYIISKIIDIINRKGVIMNIINLFTELRMANHYIEMFKRKHREWIVNCASVSIEIEHCKNLPFEPFIYNNNVLTITEFLRNYPLFELIRSQSSKYDYIIHCIISTINHLINKIMHLINLIWKKNGNIIFYIFACAYEIIDFCVCSFFLPFVIIRVY